MTARDKAQAGLEMIRAAMVEGLKDNPGITPGQMQAALGMDPWSVMQIVAKLMNEVTANERGLAALPDRPCC